MKAILLLSMCLSASVALVAQANLSASQQLVNYGKLPLAFEANQEQSDPMVKFLSRGAGYTLFLTSDEAVLALREGSSAQSTSRDKKTRTSQGGTLPETKSGVLRMKLLGASANAEVTGQDALPGKSNYFIGNDPKKWQTDVPQFSKVRYANVYPGVDLVYYGHQRELEYDFVLQPGAHPKLIRLRIDGAKQLRLDHDDIVLSTAAGDVRLRSPHIYQNAKASRHQVRGRYVIRSQNEVGFEIAAYDRRRELVIDPVLAYATCLGRDSTAGAGIAVDSAGNAYVTGTTDGFQFPIVNAIQAVSHGNREAFVTKFNAEGTAVLYSTFLGGSGEDFGAAIALGPAGNIYVTGTTQSSDFPTFHAIQPTFHGGGDSVDTFITKINADGSALIYSTYLGGSTNDYGNGIAVDSFGHAYVTGTTNSPDFPTKNAIQSVFGGGDSDAFVTEINAQGSALVYSTYIGGNFHDESSAIAVDSASRAYVTGYTESTDFPIKNALQTTNKGGTVHGFADAFVAKINSVGSDFVYSTYLGGNDFDQGNGIAADSKGNAYVTGVTDSTDFPISGALQSNCPNCPTFPDAFVTKINGSGSALVYSTYLGGSFNEFGNGIAVDASGNAYVTGFSDSSNFPLVNAIDWGFFRMPGFVSKISANGMALTFSTNSSSFRRVAVDSANSAYLVGGWARDEFPATPVAAQQCMDYPTVIAKFASQSNVKLSSPKVIFPTQVIGTTSAPRRIGITNRGSNPLPINRVFLGGLNPADYAQTSNCGTTLAPGASCGASVTFSPTAKDRRQAGLGFSSTDPASPAAAGLSGMGTVVLLSTSKLSFGDQAVGTRSSPQVVKLTNTGTSELHVSGIIIAGINRYEFSQTNTCGTSIASNVSCTISVTFFAGATGIRKAGLYISDDGGGSPQHVNLTGNGT